MSTPGRFAFLSELIFFQMTSVTKSCLSKDPLNVQEKPMDFNLIEYKKYIEIVSNATWQLTFKKLPLAMFGYSIKVDYPELFENTNKNANVPISVRLVFFTFFNQNNTSPQIECKSRYENLVVFH